MKINSVIFLTILAYVASLKDYTGYKVFKMIPETVEQVEIIRTLKGVELWDDLVLVDHEVKIMMSPQKEEHFLEIMKTNNIEALEVISDLQKVINEQMKLQRAHPRTAYQHLSFDWVNYHSLEEIYIWLDELAENYPDIITSVIIGRTVEDREIKGVILNFNPERENVKVAMIEGAIHAREWISTATVTWILKEFLISTDPEVRQLAEEFEWHIFPVVNPDGYSYTFTHDRMWRKNRSTASFTSCASWEEDDDRSNGVDLNRNFDYVWNSIGASDDPCSNVFAGVSPASEPETRAISNYTLILKERGKFVYYLSFHSYTQLIIVPYSHLSAASALAETNFADMFEIAVKSADKLAERYGTTYRIGVSGDVMYEMSGTSFDWVKQATDVQVAYLFELRDLGEFGFLLPSDQIVPNNLEIMDALLELDRRTRALGYYTRTGSGAYRVFSSLFTILFVTGFVLLF